MGTAESATGCLAGTDTCHQEDGTTAPTLFVAVAGHTGIKKKKPPKLLTKFNHLPTFGRNFSGEDNSTEIVIQSVFQRKTKCRATTRTSISTQGNNQNVNFNLNLQ
ncbi:hypothetical protein V9T40_005429 [Parthenolecanium corni]|uniref:Uncharacterized protein n=1 Tax=Parthenolecanium corni TaxID=536013 RepID=A0AAN9Y4I3_9HEMI